MKPKSRIEPDYKIAMAASLDAGNRSCKKAGRKKWSREDWNEAVKAFEKIYPIP